MDGELSDPGWAGAVRVEEWFEIRPGDNVAPKVRTVGHLAYDDQYLYAGFEFHDPEPSKIRAPYSDRDDISESIDYGGVVLDTRNDGRTGILFLATPRGIQYDAIQDDATGSENSAPDFYWDSAGRITEDGWTLEIRIPFSSLRYAEGGAVRPGGSCSSGTTRGSTATRCSPRGLAARRQLLHLPRATPHRPRGPPRRGRTSSSRRTSSAQAGERACGRPRDRAA